MKPFTSSSTAKLTSTTSSQTVTVPAGFNTLVAYNGGTYPVYFAFAASVAVPSSTFSNGVTCVAPNTTQSFAISPAGGTLAYIADTAGGSLIISLGDGA